MKRHLWLAFAFLAFLSRARCQDTPPEPPAAKEATPELPRITSQILVAKIRAGRFVDGTDAEKAGVSKLGLPETPELLPAAEAEAVWKGRSSLMDLTKQSTEEHYVIGLKDRRGRIFHELITPAKIPDDTGNRLRQVLVRQEEILRLLDESDKQDGDERLKTLSRVAEMMGPAEFNAAYPEFATAITQSTAPFLADIRAKLTANAAGQERTQLVNRLHFDLSMTLRNVPADASPEKQIEAVDKFIEERKLEPEMKQIMMMRKYLLWSGGRRYEEALATLDEALKIAPSSTLAGRIPGFQAATRAKMDSEKGAPQDDGGDSKKREQPEPGKVEPPPNGQGATK